MVLGLGRHNNIHPNTDIKDPIVSRNYIINIPRQVTTYISEGFILGDIEKKMMSAKGTRIYNLIAALLNVIKGDINLVGNIPLTEMQVKTFKGRRKR